MSAQPRVIPDLETEPEIPLEDLLREQARGRLREGDLARAAMLACDAWGIPEGPLLFRLGILAERAKGRGA